MMESQSANMKHVLATDLDGTLIPLEGNQANRVDLDRLRELIRSNSIPLIFVTGRHVASVQAAIAEHHLPTPDWVICDVGTSIFQPHVSSQLRALDTYTEHQQLITAKLSVVALQSQLVAVAGLHLQEPEKQGRFKLSYYAEVDKLDAVVAQIQSVLDQCETPYGVISSIDPFKGHGLVDLLPKGISKSYALNWLTDHVGIDAQSLVFAGDSGNDLTALTVGFRSIVVGNADRKLAEQVRRSHQASGWTDRLYLASGPATSGVLEGCQKFGMFKTERRHGSTSIEKK